MHGLVCVPRMCPLRAVDRCAVHTMKQARALLWLVSLYAWCIGQLLSVGACVACEWGDAFCGVEQFIAIIPLSSFLSKGRHLGPLLLLHKGRHLVSCNIFYHGMTISRCWSAVDTSSSHLALACHWILGVNT